MPPSTLIVNGSSHLAAHTLKTAQTILSKGNFKLKGTAIQQGKDLHTGTISKITFWLSHADPAEVVKKHIQATIQIHHLLQMATWGPTY